MPAVAGDWYYAGAPDIGGIWVGGSVPNPTAPGHALLARVTTAAQPVAIHSQRRRGQHLEHAKREGLLGLHRAGPGPHLRRRQILR